LRTAGLGPYHPDLVLSSYQVSDRPTTPPATIQPIDTSDRIYRTPQRSHDVYQAQQQLQRSEPISRNTRTLFTKVAKALAQAQSYAAQLETSNQQLRQKLDSITSRHVRRRVQVNPNSRFSEIDTIMAAVDRAAYEIAESSTARAAQVASRAAEAAGSIVYQNR
jgi:hypothetical protein